MNTHSLKQYCKKILRPIKKPINEIKMTSLKLTKNEKAQYVYFVEHIYQLVLQRNADHAGLMHWSSALADGLHPMAFLSALMTSEEFINLPHPKKLTLPNYSSASSQSTDSIPSSRADRLDSLNFIDLFDDWKKFEDIITKQHEEDPSTKAQSTLNLLYLNKNRDNAFAQFKQSNEFQYIHHLLKILNIGTEKTLCEVGGGAGYLAWALHTSGFQSVDLFEPNPTWTSGIGYLQSRSDCSQMKIYSDLHQWHNNSLPYDVIISKACLHHFGNISHIAASIRQKMRMGGQWVALREQFADTPAELVTLLTEHDYCQEYKLYEWGYSAAAYVEALEMVGLRLKAIVPAYYANDCIGTHFEKKLSDAALAFTAEIDQLLQHSPEITIERFWQEHYARRNGRKVPLQYTRPQAMIFEKILV